MATQHTPPGFRGAGVSRDLVGTGAGDKVTPFASGGRADGRVAATFGNGLRSGARAALARGAGRKRPKAGYPDPAAVSSDRRAVAATRSTA